MGKYYKRADGRFQARIPLGVDPTSGKYVYKCLYARTVRELERKVADYTIKRRLGKGAGITARQMQCTYFSEIAEKWIERGEMRASETVKRQYASAIKNYLTPAFGRKRIEAVQKSDLVNLLGYVAGLGRSRGLCKMIKNVAAAIMELAADEGYILRNPFANIKHIPGKQGTRQALTEEQKNYVLGNWRAHKMGVPALVMMLCGLRRGELLALKWDEVSGDEINITKAVYFPDGQRPAIKAPKSAAGVRVVPIPQKLREVLRECNKFGEYVCTADKGGQMNAGNFRYEWGKYMQELRKVGIDNFTAHQLRHTYATLLYTAGVDVLTAQKLLGHSSPAVTMGVYTHLERGKERQSIQALDAYLKE